MSPSVANPRPSAASPPNVYFSVADVRLRSLMQLYNDLVESGDFRTKDWPLVDTPLYPLVAIVAYLLFCVNARKISSNLPNFQLRPLVIAYNTALVFFSAYMCYEFFASAVMSGMSWSCNDVQMDTEFQNMRLARVCWWFYVSKYVEMLETVMFAMRKKYNQMSILHVYHHSTMVFITWYSMKVAAGGMTFMFGGINCFVHTVMYTYYGLSSVGPHMQKYLWWKRYITILQLIQFVFLFVMCYNVISQDCGYSLLLTKMELFYSVTLLLLFLNFYVKSYIVIEWKTNKKLLHDKDQQRKIYTGFLSMFSKKEI